jgi:hypothetical protein
MTARAEFYDKYKREADEYDKDFIKKYDEDLNTTLIFVSGDLCGVCNRSNGILGWIVFRCDFSVCHRHPTRHQRGFQRNVRETPPRPRSERQRHCVWTTRRSSTPRLETVGQELRQRSVYDVRQSRSVGSRCLPRYAWEAVAEPIRPNRDARDADTTKPTSTQEDDRDGGLAFRYHDGSSPRHAPDRAPPVLLWAFGYLWNVNQTVAAVIIATSSLGFVQVLIPL